MFRPRGRDTNRSSAVLVWLLLCSTWQGLAWGGELTSRDDSLMSAAASLPPCAITCMLESIPKSPCTLTNTTCVCTNTELQQAVGDCIFGSCTIQEALQAQNVSAAVCQVPVRDLSGSYVATCVSTGIVAFIAVALRIGYNFFLSPGGLGVDDWLMLTAGVITIPCLFMEVYGMAGHGLGRDVWMVSFDDLLTLLRYFYVVSILYFAVGAMLKFTLVLFYLRLFLGRFIRPILLATATFIAMFGVAFFFAAMFACTPISYTWNRWAGETGHCVDSVALIWTHAAINIALDVWLLAIPLAKLHSLHMPWKKKIAVGLMFSVGLFVTAVSILRLVHLLNLVNYGTSANPTWDNLPAAMWSWVELTVGFVCLCMPSIRLLLMRAFPRWLDSTRAHSGAVDGDSARKKTGVSRSNWGGQARLNDSQLLDNSDRDLDEREGSAWTETLELDARSVDKGESGVDLIGAYSSKHVI